MEQSVKDILADDFWIMPATPEYIDEGVPYITSKNIKNGIIDFTKVNYISQDAYENISKNRPILVGDILISMIGTLGETAEVKESDGSFYGQNMFLVRLDESKINKRYFLNFFKSNCVKRVLEGKQNQSTQKYLKANHIEDLIIPVPALDEQKLIAKQLDKLAGIIALRNEELKYLDNLIKARFVEMFGNKKYPAVPLIDTVKAGAGLSYGIVVPGDNVAEGIPMVRPSDFKNGQLDLSNVYKVAEEIECKYAKTRLVGDEILVQVIGQPGQVMLATDDCVGMNVTRNLAVIRPNHEIINRIYLKEYIEKEDSQQILLKNTKQSTLKQLPLNLLKQLEVQLPPMELQNKFADFVYQVDKSKVAVKKALDQAQLLFDSLMQQYFG